MRVGGPSSAGTLAGQYSPVSIPTPAEAQFSAEKNVRQGERDLLVREGAQRSYQARSDVAQFTDQVRHDAISYNSQAQVLNESLALRRQSFGAASEQYSKGAIIDVYI